MNALSYNQRIRAEQEYLYRIAYFYSGDEATALETVRETVLKGFLQEKQPEGEREFRQGITKILLQQGAVNQKPNRYLTALYLRHIVRMEIPEIAYVMDIPEGAVKAYLCRAKEEMRQDTAGISAEVRQLCGVEVSDCLKDTVNSAFVHIYQTEHQKNLRRIRKICISGVVAAGLLFLLVSGISLEKQQKNQENGQTEAVHMSTIEEGATEK